eukprot:8996234-Pyramimonas_sp.AAC.1
MTCAAAGKRERVNVAPVITAGSRALASESLREDRQQSRHDASVLAFEFLAGLLHDPFLQSLPSLVAPRRRAGPALAPELPRRGAHGLH